jgi:hypothetical protein
MIKLSELKDNDLLIVDNKELITKAEFLEQHKAEDKYILNLAVKEYEANFDAMNMIEKVINSEQKFMYKVPSWSERIKADIMPDDIKEIQDVLDRILDRHKEWNVSYSSGEEVEINLEEEKEDENI